MTEKTPFKKWKIYTTCFSLLFLLISGLIFSNFLPNATYSDVLFYIIAASTIMLTIYFYRFMSLRIKNHKVSANADPSFKKPLVLVFITLSFAFPLSWIIIGRSLPCLYTSLAGSDGIVLVKVTGWNADARYFDCTKPYVEDIDFLAPARGLCVDRSDRSKYPKGTTLRLKGKISALGININQMEIARDAHHLSQ